LLGQQFLLSLQLNRAESLGRLGALERALCFLDRGLERTLLDLIESVALLDGRTLLEDDLFQVALYARLDQDVLNRLNAPDEIQSLGD
jgi:hypothetical protein